MVVIVEGIGSRRAGVSTRASFGLSTRFRRVNEPGLFRQKGNGLGWGAEAGDGLQRFEPYIGATR
jgi:hypothetical protein